MTNPQLAMGPQKCVVLGPVGEFTNCMTREADMAPVPVSCEACLPVPVCEGERRAASGTLRDFFSSAGRR
jgi:hypothetical protein